MSRRILLINANRCTVPDPVFPLGLAQLNGALTRAGYYCIWLDALADSTVFEDRIINARPDFVGVSVRNIDDVLIRKQQTFVGDLKSLTLEVRRLTKCPIIIGGSGFSIFPRELMESADADFGIVGEGEGALPALLVALENGKDYQSIPGLVFRRNGQVCINASRPDLADSELSAEDWPERVANYYLNTSGTLNVQTQRGCAFHCCYCTYPVIEGRLHRRRSPESVASEFKHRQRLGAKYIFVVDSVFNSSLRHVTEVCEALIKSEVKIPWGCFLRPQGLSRELMHLMARSGLAHIEFGSDSFCDEVLQAYHKAFGFEDILLASELAREEKIDYCHYLIAGGPGETYATLCRSFENSRRLRDAVIMAVVGMRIYPGTELLQRAVTEGRIAPDADLLAPAYYLAAGLDQQETFRLLEEFARRSANWIVGDPEPAYTRFVGRLRGRGVVGPLWSYLSMIQHIRPQELAAPREGS